ncbi:MAG TPA: DUF4446 family protein [Tissierellaceae bacterium]|nr:DUF4446 family protein [Tissierellaceae bacterium]
MESLRLFISYYYIELIMGLSIISLLLILFIIISQHRTRKLAKKYYSLVNGIDGINIEDLLAGINKEIKKLDRDINLIEENINMIETKLSFAIRKVGFIRYSAFDDMGSQLSFSIALLDDFKNGFVLSSIYGRENTVSYGKPIKNGTSNIPLSAEEIIAIDRAIKGEYMYNI